MVIYDFMIKEKTPLPGGINNLKINCLLRNHGFKTRKIRAEDPVEEPIAHQCQDGIGPNIFTYIYIYVYIYTERERNVLFLFQEIIGINLWFPQIGTYYFSPLSENESMNQFVS